MRHFSIPWILSLVIQLLALAQIHSLGAGAFIYFGFFVFGMSAPMIKCKKTPRKKCRFMAEEAKKR
jgi:hypothetical protein